MHNHLIHKDRDKRTVSEETIDGAFAEALPRLEAADKRNCHPFHSLRECNDPSCLEALKA